MNREETVLVKRQRKELQTIRKGFGDGDEEQEGKTYGEEEL